MLCTTLNLDKSLKLIEWKDCNFTWFTMIYINSGVKIAITINGGN